MLATTNSASGFTLQHFPIHKTCAFPHKSFFPFTQNNIFARKQTTRPHNYILVKTLLKLPFLPLASLHKLSETFWTSEVDNYTKTTDIAERQEDKGRLLPLETCSTLEIVLKREERTNSNVEDSFCKLHNMITVHHQLVCSVGIRSRRQQETWRNWQARFSTWCPPSVFEIHLLETVLSNNPVEWKERRISMNNSLKTLYLLKWTIFQGRCRW